MMLVQIVLLQLKVMIMIVLSLMMYLVILCILSVAVVEFGTHTPQNWSETYHGVSMDC